MSRREGSEVRVDQPALWPSHTIARAISLSLFVTGAVIAVLMPHSVSQDHALATDAILPVLCLALAGSFVHAGGYRPSSPLLGIMTGPLVLWPLLIASLVLLIFCVR